MSSYRRAILIIFIFIGFFTQRLNTNVNVCIMCSNKLARSYQGLKYTTQKSVRLKMALNLFNIIYRWTVNLYIYTSKLPIVVRDLLEITSFVTTEHTKYKKDKVVNHCHVC